MKNQEDRFVTVFRGSGLENAEVLIDTKTGVNYLFFRRGYAGGLTPLLDSDGKVIVSREYPQDEK